MANVAQTRRGARYRHVSRNIWEVGSRRRRCHVPRKHAWQRARPPEQSKTGAGLISTICRILTAFRNARGASGGGEVSRARVHAAGRRWTIDPYLVHADHRCRVRGVPIEALLAYERVSPMGKRLETSALDVLLERCRFCNLLQPILSETQVVARIWSVAEGASCLVHHLDSVCIR